MVNTELKKEKIWLDVNRLSLNLDKTKFITFKSPQHHFTEVVNIKVGSVLDKQSKYVKFLGVLLGENLPWEYYLTEQSKTLSRT